MKRNLITLLTAGLIGLNASASNDFMIGSYLGETSDGSTCSVSIAKNEPYMSFRVTTSIAQGRTFIAVHDRTTSINASFGENDRWNLRVGFAPTEIKPNSLSLFENFELKTCSYLELL